MKLERTSSSSNVLPRQDDSAMSILEKCDTQIRALVKPEEPLPLVNHMVLGKIASDGAEKVASLLCVGAGGALAFTAGIGQTVSGNLEVGLSIFVSGISLLVFGAVNFMALDLGEKGIGYRAQKLWQKMGLPARRLKALEMERATNLAQYKKKIATYETTIAQLEETAKPVLETINQKNTKYEYSFGLKGLDGILIVEEPAMWVRRIAEDLERIATVQELESVKNTSGNLSLDIRNI